MMTVFAQASVAAQPLRRSDNLLPGDAAEAPFLLCSFHSAPPALQASGYTMGLKVAIDPGGALHLTR
jgi:hypothetical protein